MLQVRQFYLINSFNYLNFFKIKKKRPEIEILNR